MVYLQKKNSSKRSHSALIDQISDQIVAQSVYRQECLQSMTCNLVTRKMSIIHGLACS